MKFADSSFNSMGSSEARAPKELRVDAVTELHELKIMQAARGKTSGWSDATVNMISAAMFVQMI